MTPKNPNPQGKGLTPVMETLLACRARTEIPAKTIEQITCELFTSMFVLRSEFKFRPVMGQQYWLYRHQEAFKLSLIAPAQWRHDHFGQYVGECILQQDMTWTLTLGEQAQQNQSLLEYIERERRKFNEQLAQQTELRQIFPVYEAKLPFYQRALASGLAFSLGVSLDKKLLQNEGSQLHQIDQQSSV